MGHADHEISAAFSQFDRDGNQILDEDEQKRMKMELEEKRVSALPYQDKIYRMNMILLCHSHRFVCTSLRACVSVMV